MKNFENSLQGKQLKKEIEDAIRVLDKHGVASQNGRTLYFPNSRVDDLEKELNDVERQLKQIEKGYWGHRLEAQFNRATQTKDAQEAEAALKQALNTPNGREVQADAERLIKEIQKNVKVTDLPK